MKNVLLALAIFGSPTAGQQITQCVTVTNGPGCNFPMQHDPMAWVDGNKDPGTWNSSPLTDAPNCDSSCSYVTADLGMVYSLTEVKLWHCK